MGCSLIMIVFFAYLLLNSTNVMLPGVAQIDAF